jgi:16S rRNA (uracil1498-N3)-methyltransferase
MHRCFVPPDRLRLDVFDLDEAEARHAVQVLRLGPGDRVGLLDGAGGLAEGLLEEAGRRNARVRVVGRTSVPAPAVPVHLLVALLKGKALDLVLEKAVELGAASIVLLETDHGVARVPSEDVARKRETWRQTLVEAAKQSRNPWLPDLVGPVPVDAAAETAQESGDVLLLASLAAETRPLGTVLAGLPRQITGIRIAVGPEGDFTEREERRFRSAGALAIDLGPRILRAETAAIAALAIASEHTRR